MNLLDKFTKVDVDNMSRIDESTLKLLNAHKIVVDVFISETNEHIAYLEAYHDKEIFKESISTLKNSILNERCNFIHRCKASLEERYFINLKSFSTNYHEYRDKFLECFGECTVENVLVKLFEYTDNVSLYEFEKIRVKKEIFDNLDGRWQKTLPSFTKTGLLTIPKYFYINRTDCNYHKIGGSDETRFLDLIRAIELFENDNVGADNKIRPLISRGSYSSNIEIKTGTIKLDESVLASFLVTRNGTTKLRFTDKSDAYNFFHFFGLENLKDG